MVTSWNLGQLAEAGRVVVSELATNAVNASTDGGGHPRYLGDGQMPLVQLRLFSEGTTLLIEVHDMAAGQPLLTAAAGDSENGRGLVLVQALTDGNWGWHPVPAGKCVWAALRGSG
jgi:hypothetical protein